MEDTFYETLALAAFALLGLWWVVVAERRREWVALPYRRRQAYTISLYSTITVPLYAIVAAVAIHPSLAPDIGIHLKPLETEATAVSLLFFLGINYGWLLFMEPAYPAEPQPGQTDAPEPEE